MQLTPDQIGQKIKETRQEYKNLDPNILGIAYMKKYGNVNAPDSPQTTSQPMVDNVMAGQPNTIMSKIIDGIGKITQRFGNRSSVEKYSKGINYGTDFAIPKGTIVALPPGQWEVVDVFNKATLEGPNNPQGGINKGYGNSVLVRNRQTGEKLRFSHLSKVAVKKGQVTNGGRPIGLSGATGNVAGRTGQHLDLEYYNQQGKIADVLNSIYKNYL